jgi:hypothetical protein
VKKTTYHANEASRILTGLIVHDGVLAKVVQRLGGELHPFNQRWLDLIAGWCFNHYRKYGKAPRGAVQSLFEKHAQKNQDEDVNNLVEKFLSKLSDDYKGLKEEINEDFLVDLASTYFKKVRLEKVADEIKSAVESGDTDEAELKYSSYKPIDFSSTAPEDPFSKAAILETFKKNEESESVVQWPGDMDRFMSRYFKRGGFIAFTGPEKRGKSFWMLETVWLALKQRKKVLYYVFGDMPKHEVYQRLYVRMTRKPWETEDLLIPKGIRITGEEKKSAECRYKKERRKGLRPKEVWLAKKKLLRVTASHQVNLKVITCGGNMKSASDLEREIEEMSTREGWDADLVVVDYADLLASEAETRRLDVRHQINLTWMILRRIALNRHLCLVTGTQAAATAYEDKWVIRKGDFSEDKRKHAHVTGMLGINQTSNEKKQGIYRLNWVDLRQGRWSETQCCWCAGELAIACPCIVSKLPD